MPLRARLLRGTPLLTPACVALLVAGCAGNVPPPVPPPVVVAPPAPPPPPDVSAVPVPANLLFFARVSTPAASIKVATDWAHLPAIDPAVLIEGALEGVTDRKDNAALASIVDAQQAIDVAASFEAKLPPKMFGAFSAAVKDLDAAKRALAATYELVPGEGGVWKLAPHAAAENMSTEKPAKSGHADPSDDGDGPPACELAPAAGAAPFRLICGSSAASLSALGPYLARTTPRDTLRADVHMEMHAGPIGGYATLGRIEGPKMLANLLGLNASAEPATLDLVTATLGDLFDYMGDLDAMTLDATLDPAHAGVDMRTTFRSSTSLIARLATAHAERVDVPPSTFWRLPGDVDFAAFGSGVDDADLAHPRDLVVAAVGEQLQKVKLVEGDRRALSDLVKQGLRGAGGVFAHGMVDDASYWLFEWDVAPAQSERLVRDAVAAVNRPGVSKWMKGAAAPSPIPAWRMGAPLAGLPKGSLHVEVTIPPDMALSKVSKPKHGHAPPPAPPKGAKVAPEVVHFAIVPDGARTWMAMSTSPAALRAKLAPLVAPTPPADPLGPVAAARGLDGFKESRMTTGGFFTIRSILALAQESARTLPGAKAGRFAALIRSLPAKGTTPILMTAAPGAPTTADPGGVREAHVNIPADAIRDMVWLALQADDVLKN